MQGLRRETTKYDRFSFQVFPGCCGGKYRLKVGKGVAKTEAVRKLLQSHRQDMRAEWPG